MLKVQPNKKNILETIKEYSDTLDYNNKKIVIILAGGQGKRIKSSTPKVLHTIWGVPAIFRLINTVCSSLKTTNQIIIVGNQAEKVIHSLGKTKNRIYVYQEKQLGTGHAIQQVVKAIDKNYQGTIFSFPGDLGLLDKKTINDFQKSYYKSNNKMFLLTGNYDGNPWGNFYGRIIRKKQSKKILDIVQYKDILNLKKNQFLKIKGEAFDQEFLINASEFDSGIFAFDFPELAKNIFLLKTNNIQQEYYLTDLVKIYSQKNIPFDSLVVKDMKILTGFNDKSILKEVEKTFQKNYYEKLKNIISIEDEKNFYLSEKTISNLMKKDKQQGPLDINIKSGVYIDENVILHKKINLGKNVRLEGNITIKDGVQIGDNVSITTYPNQKITIASDCVFHGNNVIKGNVKINAGTILHEGVNLTGSNEHPTVLGKKVTIHGSCYLYGCLVESESEIESSILIKQKIKCIKLQNGKVQPIKFIIPPPVGIEALHSLD